jgi:hypothetical protein
MIEVKLFEVRDCGTFLPMMAVFISAAGSDTTTWLLNRGGYGVVPCILFGCVDGGHFAYDPYQHNTGSRTRMVAHNYLHKHWFELKSGDVIDVEFILGERTTIKESERCLE